MTIKFFRASLSACFARISFVQKRVNPLIKKQCAPFAASGKHVHPMGNVRVASDSHVHTVLIIAGPVKNGIIKHAFLHHGFVWMKHNLTQTCSSVENVFLTMIKMICVHPFPITCIIFICGGKDKTCHGSHPCQFDVVQTKRHVILLDTVQIKDVLSPQEEHLRNGLYSFLPRLMLKASTSN